MTDRDFWLLIRRALLMIVQTNLDIPPDVAVLIRRALLMIVQAIERKYLCKDPVDIVQ